MEQVCNKQYCNMKIKFITGIILLLLVITSCSFSIINAHRGPRYEGKFDISTYPEELDSTCYYVNTEVRSEEEFTNHGVFLSL